jgi:hypothetical protein
LATEKAVRIDQCLFGYSDGHRLLAASRNLPNDAASLLLVHSDAVPGIGLDPNGYWTGLPLPSARAYALMRTWPAPEMPRPGCVWSHALVVASADMARFSDMQTLARLTTRPRAPRATSEYTTPILAEPTSHYSPPLMVSLTEAHQIFTALYAAEPRDVLQRTGRERETALFAVWSQQWPRLRRTFAFQTAGFAGDTSSTFSLRFVDDLIGMEDKTKGPAPWERSALDDLKEPGEFRRFIWRYGADLEHGRKRFRLLAELFNVTRQSILGGDRLTAVLDEVVNTMPGEHDGRLLKADLMASGQRDFSLIPLVDTLDALDYALRQPQPATLPLPNPTNIPDGDLLWPARASRFLTLLERASRVLPALAADLVGKVMPHIDADTFFAECRDHPNARLILVAANPLLLDSPGLEKIPQPDLDTLLRYLPDDLDFAGRILDRLLILDDELAAKTFATRFPSLAAERVFDALAQQLAHHEKKLPDGWMNVIDPILRAKLPDGMLPRIDTTSALAVCARLLKFDVSAGLKSSSKDWALALARSHDDVSGQPRQRLMAYLLTLGLANPAPGSELLFEWAFESVHADIAVSRLQYDAFNALRGFLPDVYWWQEWDTCLRLRIAVADAYANNQLSPGSFRRLTDNPSLFDELVDRLSRTRQGRQFIQHLADNT